VNRVGAELTLLQARIDETERRLRPWLLSAAAHVESGKIRRRLSLPDGAWYDAISMRDPAPHARFVVDTMLGRLARWLRAMGFDTLYPGQVEDHRLLHLAHAEDRVLVTRDRRLARLAHPRGCLIQSEVVDHQIVEMRERLGLAPPPRRG
jgi:hypothetical protein